ncbi:NapC/NirT family cytochrome c [Sulfurimonas sp.]|uniref:cytochrome c3 family protein n=1 Tax=Sulfurimonas sp. TaxID=2022749 RepID=UPI0019D93723|nr:NapC/NirT family cytochrome c [Sulfurimonas sp.]MBE0514627.1 NapC/NirT family cytochrome c [Sulfurimonas sp.]
MEEEKVIIKDMKETKRRYSFGLMAIVGIVVAGVLIGMGTSFFTVVAVKHTSDVNFCGSCHSMKPMAEAYRNSVHGGYGESGIMATCADCHLPHKSTAGYLVQKVRTGLWDVWVETTHDTSKIDWHEKREERRNWVYDSACLHCHENLLLGTRPNKKAFTAHKAYFAKKLVVSGDDGKKESAKCVDCHKHVGHYQLEKHLPPRPSEVMDEEENVEH